MIARYAAHTHIEYQRAVARTQRAGRAAPGDLDGAPATHWEHTADHYETIAKSVLRPRAKLDTAGVDWAGMAGHALGRAALARQEGRRVAAADATWRAASTADEWPEGAR